jgi:hypothetical protein
MVCDMPRKVILLAEGGEAIGREGAVSAPAILLCIVVNCTSASKKTEPEWTSSMAST